MMVMKDEKTCAEHVRGDAGAAHCRDTNWVGDNWNLRIIMILISTNFSKMFGFETEKEIPPLQEVCQQGLHHFLMSLPSLANVKKFSFHARCGVNFNSKCTLKCILGLKCKLNIFSARNELQVQISFSPYTQPFWPVKSAPWNQSLVNKNNLTL